MERARAAGEQARADASKPGKKAPEQPGVVGVPGMGEQAMGAAMLERLQVLDAERWRVTMPLIGILR